MKIKAKEKTLGDLDFQKTKDDNKLALSIEDEKFLKIMDEHMYNSWVLSFKHPRPHLPNNKEQVLSRLSSLRCALEKKPTMKEQFIGLMQKIFVNDHTEVAPTLPEDQECWYLPT